MKLEDAALRSAAKDGRLRGSDLRVYAFLRTELDLTTYRPVKQTWVVRAIALSRWTVQQALRRLEGFGYLERAEQPDGQIIRYRANERAN